MRPKGSYSIKKIFVVKLNVQISVILLETLLSHYNVVLNRSKVFQNWARDSFTSLWTVSTPLNVTYLATTEAPHMTDKTIKRG